MNKLILNDIPLDLNTFSHNMSIRNDVVTNTIYASIAVPLRKTMIGLEISYIAIVNSLNETIYELTNLNAILSSINVTIKNEVIETNLSITNI